MPSLLSKYKKRRESQKGDDGSSITSHDADQRSPSGSSVRSVEGQLGAVAGAAPGARGAKGQQFTQLSQNAQQQVSNVQQQASSAQQAAQHATQNAQQQVQQAQQAGQKMLNSPFLGQRSPQGTGPVGLNGAAVGNGGLGHASHAGNGNRSSSGQQLSGQAAGPLNKLNGPGTNGSLPHTQNGTHGGASHPTIPAPYAPQHAPQHAPQQFHPNSMSPISPPPHGQAPLPQGRAPSGSASPAIYSPGSAGSPGGPGADGAHERDRQFQQRYRQPPHEAFKSPLSEPSETPWAEYAIQRACPSPRFGHSANYVSARDGELFIMGGIRDSDILSDLWVIDTNMLTGYQLVTEGARVGPRVGHSSLVLGNAHVMFGGDTKIEESDPLDDNLYLLNTSSLKWTVAQPTGPRPSGRYGHSLSNVGARIFVFGGQVDEQFYNDMWAFDLQSWRSPSARWELITPVSEPPSPRTNHTIVTWNDKLYLFGGANGDLWYSDTWSFDPATRRWEQLDCTGYVPAPCQGHAATIIGDVMYVFGGMSSQGILIDQLFALKLTTLKWYTFQNLGPGPSPRSGHSLTAFNNDKILVWGGTDQGNSAYVLDVSRINYPDDSNESEAAGEAAGVAPVPTVPVEQKELDSASPQTRPQGLDASGPTQGRANPAARNSMLFSKRRSVIAPASPVRSAGAGPASNGPASNGIGASDLSRDQQQFQSQLQGSTAAAELSSARSPDSSPLRSHNDSGDNRSPNRTHVTPTSYISEHEGSSDERFVSAVDDFSNVHNPLSGTKQQSQSLASQPLASQPLQPQLPYGHSRDTSVSNSETANDDSTNSAEKLSDHDKDVDSESRNNTLTRADVSEPSWQDEEFQSMEKELNGMPGGLPNKPPTIDRAPGTAYGQTASDHPESPNNELGEDTSISNGLNGVDEQSSARAPGLRRSHPQTNLSLQSRGEEDDSELANGLDGSKPTATSPTGTTGTGPDQASQHQKHLGAAAIGAVGAAGAGIIGLSDQMSLPHNSHAVQSQQVQAGSESFSVKSNGLRPDDADATGLGTAAAPSGTQPQRSGSQSSRFTEDSITPSFDTAGGRAPTTSSPLGSPISERQASSKLQDDGPVPQRIPSQSAQRHARSLSNVQDHDNASSNNANGPVGQKAVLIDPFNPVYEGQPKSGQAALATPAAPAPGHTSPVNQVDQLARDPKSRSSPREQAAVSPAVQQYPSPQVSNKSAAGPTSTPGAANAAALGPITTHALNGAGAAPAAAVAGVGSAGVAAELAQLRQQLNAYRQRDFDDEHHKLKESHAAKDRELTGLRDTHGNLQKDHSQLQREHKDLQTQHNGLKEIMDAHVTTLQTQQQELSAVKTKLFAQQEEIGRLSTVENENASLKHQLEQAQAARKYAEDQLEAMTQAHTNLSSRHTELNEKHTKLAAAGAGAAGAAGAAAAGEAAGGLPSLDDQVSHIAQLWQQYNRGTTDNSDPALREANLSSAPGDDYRSLYETHKTAAESAQQQLEAAYAEQASLKAQVRDLSLNQSSAPSAADLELLKEQHQSALVEMEKMHKQELASKDGGSEELRARLQHLESSFSELSGEYQKAVDLSKNQQVALARTREDLNTSRAHAQRLEEQLQDASLQAPLSGDAGDVSAHSVSSARNDQAALVIRDLRTQIVILEEEMQTQRDQIMKLKKAALSAQ